MEKVLVDSNIFLDYYLDRKSGLLPIGEFAFQFMKRTIECNYYFIICTESIWEMSVVLKISEAEVHEKILSPLKVKNKFEIFVPLVNQKREAKSISQKRNIPYTDALFAIVARDLKIRIVTRDKHFFEELDDVVNSVKPEEL
jgi:predicted nucleic acid-binding protein